jgi:tetratricopeptide (TPR) repeat protein/WD40 repeat protein
MPLPEKVLELLLHYEEVRGQGRHITPEELCTDCPTLLEQVKRAIRELESVGGMLDLTQTEEGPPPAFKDYEILGELGRGGMGVVYRARQQGLNRLVALKMILAGEHAGSQHLARFRAEAEAVARLQHPNVVQVHEVGEQDGRPFFSMEFVEGGSLAGKLAGTPQPARPAAELVEVLARAIQAAHQRGIVHRDLKPANILLAADGTPKISDFGLAKKLDEAAGQTASGAILGTPSYMAPEQASGGKRPVGPAADVYALGAILYELLTGRPPFKAETTFDTLRQVLTEEPVPPRRLNGKVPRDLETICLKCLLKEPRKRYPSAAELADDLGHFLAGEPITARPVRVWEKGWKWARRRPAAALLLVAVLLLVAASVGGLFALWRGSEARQRARQAEAEASEARTEQLRKTLAEYHARADAALNELQLLRHAAGPDVAARVFAAIEEVAGWRTQAERALRDAEVPGVSAAAEQRRWDDRAAVLRQEVTRWLVGLRLHQGRSIPLPEDPNQSRSALLFDQFFQPQVAVRPDLRQVAVVYPGDTSVYLVDPDGGEQRRLAIPPDAVSRPKGVGIHPGLTDSPLFRPLYAQPGRLAYVAPDRLELQIGEQLLSWSLRTGRLRRARRPPAPLPPALWRKPLYAGGKRWLAARSSASAPLTLREWDPNARPRVVWQLEETSQGRLPEQVFDMAFGGDGQALFVLTVNGTTANRLSLIDALGGSGTEVGLREEGTDVAPYHLIPCSGGVAILQRRAQGKKAPRYYLEFWRADVPQAAVRGLHQDDVPRCLSWAGDGLLVVGAADHRVHAWRGGESAWASGIPYLVASRQDLPEPFPFLKTRTRIPVADLSERDLSPLQSVPQEARTWSLGWRRRVWAQTPPTLVRFLGYSPPLPYPNWQFGRTGSQSLVVSRRELLPNGGSRERTELYAADTGRLQHAFPVEGKGRILFPSEDRRFAVVVAEEKGSRATLEVWSIPQYRRLDGLGRYTLPAPNQWPSGPDETLSATFTAAAGKDWLLLGRALPTQAGTELAIWRLPEAEMTGRVVVPSSGEVVATDRPGQVLLSNNSWLRPPVHAQVIDLEKGRKICELEQFDAAGDIQTTMVKGARQLAVWRQGFGIHPHRVSVWDLVTGKRTDLGRTAWTNETAPALLVSPNGDRLMLTGNLHDTGMAHVELWDLTRLVLLKEATLPTTGKPAAFMFEPEHCALNIPDFPSRGQTRRLNWRWADGEETVAATARQGEYSIGVTGPDGGPGWYVWTKGGPGLYLQRGATGQLVPLENTAGINIISAAYSQAGARTLVIRGAKGGIWDAGTGRQLVAFAAGHLFRCLDPTGRWALTLLTARNELHVWDLKTGRSACRCVPAFDSSKAELRLHPGGKRLAVLARGALRLWDLEANRQLMALDPPAHFSPVRCVAQHAGAGLVGSAGGEGVIHLWKRADGAAAGVLFAQATGITALAFRPDGTALASAGDDGELALHDLRGRRLWRQPLPGPAATVTHLRFAAGLLLAATSDGRALALDAATGNVLRSHRVDGTALQALDVSPDGRALALGSRAGHVHVWDSALVKPGPHWNTYAPVPTVAFVGNELLATGGASVRFWEIRTRRAVWDVEVVGGARELRLNDRSGALAVANASDRVVVLDLPGLYRRLDERKLGFPAFPLSRWSRSDKQAPPAAAAPRQWRDWCRWAEHSLRAGRQAEAVWASSQAVALAPAEWQPWASRARAHAAGSSPNLDSALADWSQALARQSGDWQFWQGRAAVYARQFRWREAAADLDRAVALKAPGAEVRRERGRARYLSGQLDLALTDLDEATRLDPKDLDAALLRAEVLLVRGEFDRALSGLDRVVSNSARAAYRHGLRGFALSRKRDYKAALAEFDAALQLDPDYAWAYRQRGWVRSQTGNLDGAIADFTDATDLQPGNAETYIQRGDVYHSLGQHARAIEDYSTCLRIDPGQALAYNGRGLAYQRLGQLDRALTDFNRATKVNPKLVYPYWNRGELYRARQQFDRAIAEYTKGIAVQPDHPWNWVGRGHAHAERRDWTRAAADFARANQLLPGDMRPAWYRAQTLLARGDRAGYRSACADLLKRFGQTKDSGTANLVAWSGVLIADHALDARPYLQLAEKAAAANPGAATWHTLGTALYRAGRFEEAARKLAEACKQRQNGGTAFDCFVLAMTHAQLGHAAEARKWLDRASLWIENASPKKPKEAGNKAPLTWQERLQLGLLRREAETLLKPSREQ